MQSLASYIFRNSGPQTRRTVSRCHCAERYQKRRAIDICYPNLSSSSKTKEPGNNDTVGADSELVVLCLVYTPYRFKSREPTQQDRAPTSQLPDLNSSLRTSTLPLTNRKSMPHGFILFIKIWSVIPVFPFLATLPKGSQSPHTQGISTPAPPYPSLPPSPMTSALKCSPSPIPA